MSVDLYPGDKIHLAVPVSAGYPADVRAEAREMAVQLTENYAAMGVTVAFWTATTNLSHPVVVAVFRKPLLMPVEDLS